MKKQLITLCLLACSLGTNAQFTAIKAGGCFNADVVSHKLGKINYPSLELSIEQSLGRKFSINGSYNYAKGEYSRSKEGNLGPVYGNYKWINYYQSLIIEGRFYLKTNSNGLFFQLGIPFTYVTEKDYYSLPLPTGEGTTKGYFYAISTIGGMGIKYPLSTSCGIEMSINYSPSFNFLDVDYGTSGFIKTGLKFVYSVDWKKN